MAKRIFFQRLITVGSLGLLTACVSPTAQSAREPASSPSIVRTVEFHEADKNDFEVGNLHLKKFSIENREDRLEFKVKLSGLLFRKDDRLPPEAARALEEAVSLLERLDTETPSPAHFTRLQEVIEAYNSNFLSPVPRSIWLGAVPYEAAKTIHHSIMNERAPTATDLAAEVSGDSSRVDPKPSSFWKPDRVESTIDMYAGFGRKAIPKIQSVCAYDGPKKSYGTHGGFKLDCGADGKWKFKFGNESKTEPFNTRLVWALGYNVTQIDYVPAGVRVAYDRKLLTEFNSRKPLKIDVKSVLGFTYISKDLQKRLDPFESALSGAILQDGRFIDVPHLRRKLVKSIPQRNHKDDWSRADEAQFDENFEKQIKYLVLKEASIETPRPEEDQELGSWSWRSLDHPDRRELRAFGLISAWVNAFDMRQNNNKTILHTNSDGSTELIQEVSDLGSGFGDARSIFHYKNGVIDKFPRDLVRLRKKVNGESSSGWTSPYEFVHYSVLEDNPAFSRMQLDDAKWMARKLASFSEAQLRDGLRASGFTPAEIKIVLDKLLSRRQQMIDVFRP